MTDATAELEQKARELLAENRGDPGRTLAKFKALLRKRSDLLEALLLDYLTNVTKPPGDPAPAPRPPRVKSVRVGEHRRSRPRTEDERLGELRAAEHHSEVLRDVFQYRVNERPVGEFRWGELTLAVRENAYNAASYLRQGTLATEAALLLDKIYGHAQVPDHLTLVKQIISEKQLKDFILEARREAPLRIEEGMRRYADSIAPPPEPEKLIHAHA
jgi:hypothetical protein